MGFFTSISISTSEPDSDDGGEGRFLATPQVFALHFPVVMACKLKFVFIFNLNVDIKLL